MSIARNTFYNFSGVAISLAIALVTVPLYLRQIGEARYGALAIIWLLLGYFSVFDFGLSRAVANRIAQLRGSSKLDREGVFWAASTLNVIFGLVGGLVIYFAGGSLLGQWFKVSAGLRAELFAALPWIAASLPVVMLTSVLRGCLTGQEHFAALNVIQIAGSILFQMLPLAVAFIISPKLEAVIPATVAARCLSIIPLAFVVRATLPLEHRPRLTVERIRQLLNYGAWVTVTNIVGPIMVSLDRFLIGFVLNASAVAYYVVPFNLATRARTLPRALSGALFPRLSSQNQGAAMQTAAISASTLNAIMTPLIVMAILLMYPFMNLWLGSTFAERSAPVGEMLLVGTWIVGLAYVPSAMLQAQGRPDLTAKFHLAEVIPFVAALWVGLHWFGLIGAAVAWVLRVAVDAALLFWFSGLGPRMLSKLIPGAGFVIAAWVLVALKPSLYLLSTCAFVISVASWIWAYSSDSLLRARTLEIVPQANQLCKKTYAGLKRSGLRI